MQVNDLRGGAQPQVQTSSLPATPTPGAPPPWAQHGGPPAPRPPEQPQPQMVAPQPPQPVAAPPAAVAIPHVDLAAITPELVSALSAQTAPYPGAEAPLEHQIVWSLARYPVVQVRQWWAALPNEVIAALVGAYERARIAATAGAPINVHPTTRAMLEDAIRRGFTDDAILASYPQVTEITKDVLAALRYAMAVPTATTTLPQSLDQPPLATTTTDAASSAQPGIGAETQDGAGAEDEKGKPARWSKARRDRAAAMLREGRSVAEVSADPKVAMPADKVEEYRLELAAGGQLQPQVPQTVQPQVQAPPQASAAPGGFGMERAPLTGPIPGTGSVAGLSVEETEALRRLLQRAADFDRYGPDSETQAIDDDCDRQLEEIANRTDLTDVQRMHARSATLRDQRAKRAELASFPRALARAVRDVRLELAAYEKLAALLPREGG